MGATRKSNFRTGDLFIAPGPKSAHYHKDLVKIAKQFNDVVYRATERAASLGTGLRLIPVRRGLAITWGMSGKNDPEFAKAVKTGKAKKLTGSPERVFRRLLDY